MDENESYRPLSEEERRENLRKMMGDDAVEEYFDRVTVESSGGTSEHRATEPSSGLINWKFVGTVAVIFVLVMVGVYIAIGDGSTEDTVETPGGVPPAVQETETP